MLRLIELIAGLALMAGGMISVLFSMYYLFAMLAYVKPEKKRFLPFLGPAILLLPTLFEPNGKRAHIRLLISVLSLLLCFGGVALITQN